jgi:hypothetical protein
MPFELWTAARLAKEGFGTPSEVLAMPSDLVIASIEYCDFLKDYQETIDKLNRPNG